MGCLGAGVFDLMQLPVVSVIIPCYNCERYLSEAIESALAQTYPATEVVVIDDGSSDGSYAIAQRYLPRIKLLRNRRNKGRSWSRNRAVAESTGEYIALLDADDVWLPHKLNRQIAFMQAHPGVGLLYAKAECIDVLSNPLCGREAIGWPPRDDANVTTAGQTELLLGNRIPCLTALFKKDVFDSVGRFDNALWMGEDYELWLRISEKYSIGFMDEVLARYRVHGSQTTANEIARLIHVYLLLCRHIRRSAKSGKTVSFSVLQDVWIPQIEEYAGRCLWQTHEYRNAARLFLFLATKVPARTGVIWGLLVSIVKYLFHGGREKRIPASQ